MSITVNIYEPHVLSLVQLCTKIIKDHEELLKDEISIIPITLKKYVHDTEYGYIYIFNVKYEELDYCQSIKEKKGYSMLSLF
jgi:hypothetical protein